jgi:O-antigen/teichoic acid export membrane protein
MRLTPSVRHNIIANFAGKTWKGIFSLAFVPIYISIMGVEVFGLIGVFLSLSALFALLDMGLSTTLNRELSRLSVAENSAQESRNLVRTFEVVYWGIGILIGIAVIILAPLIAKYWINSTIISSETIEQALLIMGILLASQWPNAIYSGGLKGLQRQVVLNVIRSVSVTVRHGGAVLVLLFISPSILSFFLWQFFVALLTTIVLAIWLWKSLPKSGHRSKFDKKLFIKNRKFASGMMSITLVRVLLMQLDKIILSKMLTLEMFSYYMLAFNVAAVLISLVGPVYSALFPQLSQLVAGERETDISNLYHKGCQLVSIIILPISITLVFFAEEILSIWIGDPVVVRNTHMLLSLLVIGSMITAILLMPYALQLAYGWTKLAFYKSVISIIFLVPLMVWMVQMYQGIGAAWVWIILNLAYLILEVPIMHRRLLKGEMGKWYSRDVFLPILIVTIIGLIVRVILPVDSSKMIMLLGVFSTFSLSFIVSAWATGHLNIIQFIRELKANDGRKSGLANSNASIEQTPK